MGHYGKMSVKGVMSSKKIYQHSYHVTYINMILTFPETMCTQHGVFHKLLQQDRILNASWQP